MKYGVIKDGVVINVIIWDGESLFELEEGETLVPIGNAWIGWTYDGEFHEPQGE